MNNTEEEFTSDRLEEVEVDQTVQDVLDLGAVVSLLLVLGALVGALLEPFDRCVVIEERLAEGSEDGSHECLTVKAL